MATIRLPTGTEYVIVDEVPGLIVAAIHPVDVRPRTLSYIVAVRSESDRANKLTERQKRWLDASGIAVPGSDCTETDWRAFAHKLDGFRATRRRPPTWVPAPVWINHTLNAGILRIDAEAEHHRALRAAMARGDVRCLNHARLPSGGFPEDLIPVDDLRRYVEPMGLHLMIGDERPGAIPAPLQRRAAQEAAILATLRELGHDPMRLPRPRRGKSSPPLAEVRARLRYSADVMQKAMTRLLEDGRAAYGDTAAE